MSKEQYKCMSEKCGHAFFGPPGPTPCIKCGGIYVEWVNFHQDWEHVNGQWQRKSVILDLTKTDEKSNI